MERRVGGVGVLDLGLQRHHDLAREVARADRPFGLRGRERLGREPVADVREPVAERTPGADHVSFVDHALILAGNCESRRRGS